MTVVAALEHKSAEFTALNPLQRVPVLVLDDGTVITESIAICRYFEGLRPEPALFGRGALGRIHGGVPPLVGVAVEREMERRALQGMDC